MDTNRLIPYLNDHPGGDVLVIAYDARHAHQLRGMLMASPDDPTRPRLSVDFVSARDDHELMRWLAGSRYDEVIFMDGATSQLSNTGWEMAHYILDRLKKS